MEDSTDIEGPTMAEPTMMDSTMEDLFGEAADGLNVVSLSPVPLPIATILRVAEMQRRGCCTRLAWGATGSIAHITADGSKVTFRALVREKTGVWSISAGSKHPIEAPDRRKFVHVKFSGIGIDLVAIDDIGVPHMFSLTGPLDRMVPVPVDWMGIKRTELDAVVGMHWLSVYLTEFRGPYVDAALRNGDKWDVSMRQRDLHDLRIHHPSDGRNAVLYITRSGELTLLYQNDSQAWQSTSIVLEQVRTSEEMLSHAALGEDGSQLLAITYDCSSRLQLYRISINWNATPQAQTRGLHMPPLHVAPALEVRHLTSADNIRAPSADAGKLTHLRLIPAVPDVAQFLPTLPTVVAVFTHVSLPTETASTSSSYSIISRWHVETFTPRLHESFKKLKPGSEYLSAQSTVTVLRTQPDFIINKIILSFESQVFDTMFAFGTSDGTIDFRDRVTMDSLQGYGDTNKVSSLPQTGFDHIPGDHKMHVAVSPDGAAMALVDGNDRASANLMAFTHGWHVIEDGVGDNKAFIDAAAACIARQYALLCYHITSNDEALALLPLNISADIRSRVVRIIHRILSRTPDVVMQEPNKQQMIVLKDPLVPRSLSASLALGTNALTGKRSPAAQYSFTLLNLRHTAQSLASSMMRPGADAKQIPVEIFTSTCGLLKYVADLMIFLVDTVVSVKRASDGGKKAKEIFDQIKLETGNPTLPVLLSTWTRTLLRINISCVGKYFQTIQQFVLPRVRTLADRQQLTGLLEVVSKLPFKFHEFERFIVELDQVVRDTWAKSGLSSETRGELEAALMCDVEIPDELEVATDALLNTILPKLMGTMDMGLLYFWDTEQLSLASTTPQQGQPIYDVIRKTPIGKGAPLRLCRRCGSMMEDISPEKVRESPPWLANAQRHCVCLTFWILV